MNKIPKAFDYDIWKDDEGYYYVRVRRTGETTRVSNEVVRELWRESHNIDRYRRENTVKDKDNNPCTRLLSLDAIHEYTDKGTDSLRV